LQKPNLLIGFLLANFCFSLISAFQPTIVPSALALVSSSATVESQGIIEYDGGLTLKYATDFENIIKTSSTTLSMSISHEFGLGAVSGGARIWMDDGSSETNSPTPHSGSRCVGMETTTSERNEFNIYSIQNLVSPSTEYYVSEWLYLPVGWTIPSSHWYSICADLQALADPYLPRSEIILNNWDNINKIDLGTVANGVVDTYYSLPPIGQWFKFAYYVKLSTTAGIIKVWINNEEILSASGIDTWGAVGRAMLTTVAKIYGGEGKGTLRLWVDDLSIYSGAP